mmetsp:Transcript_67931/g.162213  ORF Transcript_67931/g.162213 Transcript_67931/m.162213 type:complete len:130 (-) Transcript_67931:176-565(-)
MPRIRVAAFALCLSVIATCVHAGVEIETLKAGDGKTFPAVGKSVKVHYTGTLAETGAKFDSSRDRGKPFSFTLGVGEVIKCWDEGIAQLSKGQVAVLSCTSDYGYGARGAGNVIPPNADLKFEVELIDF